jgi:hypothetical protein
MTTKDQINYRMWASVRGVLASHETDNTWTTIPALVKAVGAFDTVTINVATQLEVTALPGGAAIAKETAKKALVGPAHEVAAALHAYATEIGDDELAAQVDFSLSDLAQGHPASVNARCTRIAALATENLEGLEDSNITQAKLTALAKKITAFEKLASKPRQGVAKKAAANKALPRLMKQGRKILKRRIDRLMVQFKTSAPEFYAEYRTARKIVNAPATQNGQATNIVAANGAANDLLKAA